MTLRAVRRRQAPRQTALGRGNGLAVSIAGSIRACSAGGGDISSGNRPRPIRADSNPSHGQAVTIANGIAKAGPPARNSA